MLDVVLVVEGFQQLHQGRRGLAGDRRARLGPPRDGGGLGGIRTLAPGRSANHKRKKETPWQQIRHVKPTKATGRAKEQLEGVQERLGMTPNMMKVMAASPVVLGGYLSLRSDLEVQRAEWQLLFDYCARRSPY